MSSEELQTADAEARVMLPKGFAMATVILEQVSPNEVRIRKANGTAQEALFPEEANTTLSDRDRDCFLRLLEDPPLANAVLRKAMSKQQKRNG